MRLTHHLACAVSNLTVDKWRQASFNFDVAFLLGKWGITVRPQPCTAWMELTVNIKRFKTPATMAASMTATAGNVLHCQYCRVEQYGVARCRYFLASACPDVLAVRRRVDSALHGGCRPGVVEEAVLLGSSGEHTGGQVAGGQVRRLRPLRQRLQPPRLGAGPRPPRLQR